MRARQFIVNSPVANEAFDPAKRARWPATFVRLTAFCGVGPILSSLVWLAVHAEPANYLMKAPIVGVGSSTLTIVVTIRYESSDCGTRSKLGGTDLRLAGARLLARNSYHGFARVSFTGM
jgi:hypothetical protein